MIDISYKIKTITMDIGQSNFDKQYISGGHQLVTVIALCYNHSRFVVECLDSIRNQTYNNIQLIIMDDNSSDNSVEIIRNWISKYKVNCLFINHNVNIGLCRTLNEAISLAKGEYICHISTDDIWSHDKIEQQTMQMECLPKEVGVIYSEAYMIDEHGNRLDKMFIKAHRIFDKIPEGFIFQILVDSNFIPAMTTLIRRSCYEKVGLYDERLFFEDWDMWLRISLHFKFSFSPLISAQYRIVDSSLIRTLQKNGVQFYYTVYLIFLKLLKMNHRFDWSTKRAMRNKLSLCSHFLYKLNYDKSTNCLLTALINDIKLKTFLLFIASLFRISYDNLNNFLISKVRNFFFNMCRK